MWNVNETFNKIKQIRLNNGYKHLLDKIKFWSKMIQEKPDQKGKS